MSLKFPEKLGVIFTITFVDFILVILVLLSSKIPMNDRFPIVGVCGGFLVLLIMYAFRKKSPIQQTKISTPKYLVIFFIGVVLGTLNTIGVEFAYSIDYKNAEPNLFYIGIPLAVGGHGIFLFFTAMSMVILVTQMPFIENKKGNSHWIPFVAGVVFGFGIMTFYDVLTNGVRSLW